MNYIYIYECTYTVHIMYHVSMWKQTTTYARAYKHVTTHKQTHTVNMSMYSVWTTLYDSLDLSCIHTAFVSCNCCCVTSVTYHL